MTAAAVLSPGTGVRRRRVPTTYRDPQSEAGAFRPEVGFDGSSVPTGGHRRRPGRARCDAELVAARSAAARRRSVLLGVVAVALIVALALPWGGAGTHTLAAPGPAQAGATTLHGGAYVVRPGDTLWSIAEGLDPRGDPRRIVAELSAQVGGDTVIPGERLELP
jgi:hypothetical protein